MRQIQLLTNLRKASICIALALFALNATGQELIDLSQIPVLCDQINVYTLKKVLPDGYVYDTSGDSGEIVLTRDKDNPNRYTSRYPQSPYMRGCDYEVKRLGSTVTMLGYLEQYQEESPYIALFAADSHKGYNKQWQERMKGGIKHCDWLFNVPIDSYYLSENIDELEQMLSRLEQSEQRDELLQYNINQLKVAIESSCDDDCDAE